VKDESAEDEGIGEKVVEKIEEEATSKLKDNSAEDGYEGEGKIINKVVDEWS
jgi:hypothetical protein